MVKRNLRKVQMTGGSTLIVSLPKEWVRNVGLTPGSYVTVQVQPDGSLRITPVSRLEKKSFEAFMCVTEDMSPSMVIREFLSRYLAGYDLIRVEFKEEGKKHRYVIKHAVERKMIGMEVIEESEDGMIVQCLAAHSELPVRIALRRMSNITLSMLNDLLKNLREGRWDALKDLPPRDDNVDKFYTFILRQLKMTMIGILAPEDIGAKDLRECLGLRLVIKSVERIADHIANSAKYLSSIKERPPHQLILKLYELGEAAKKLYVKAIDAFFKFDVILAHEAADNINYVYNLENETIVSVITKVKEVEDATLLRLVAESMRRIADYSTDICEITINLNITPPKRV
ncbi:MAG: phosphate uptake regulator PhoU [Thermoprotei archaeon]|nr:phosphate uptake regulator PhoU [Thermoprotei archaeon]